MNVSLAFAFFLGPGWIDDWRKHRYQYRRWYPVVTGFGLSTYGRQNSKSTPSTNRCMSRSCVQVYMYSGFVGCLVGSNIGISKHVGIPSSRASVCPRPIGGAARRFSHPTVAQFSHMYHYVLFGFSEVFGWLERRRIADAGSNPSAE